MSVKDFILNGGLFGMLRGYDHEKEGRPYGFPELEEDAKSVMGISKQIASDGIDLISGPAMPGGGRCLMEKEEEEDE